MNIVDEYILQRFPHKDTGKPETNKPYQCRQCWHKLNYPTAEELEKHCNASATAILNYMSLYGWTDIKTHALELQSKQDLIDLRQRQKTIEKNHRRRNRKLGKVNEDYLDELLDKLTNEKLTDSEKDYIINEIRETRRELSCIQRDERVTEHLPNAYKDITGDFNVNADANVNMEGNVEVTKYTTDQARNFLNKLSEMK